MVSRGLGAGGRGINRWNTGEIQGSETILYDTIMVDTWYYAFVKIQKTVQVNINVNYGLQLTNVPHQFKPTMPKLYTDIGTIWQRP